MSPDEIFDFFWRDYCETTPDAKRVRALLEARGEGVANDHVALRTFNLAPIDLDSLAAPFLALGYRESGRYSFEEKQLDARAYSLPGQPRVFISALRTGRFSAALQQAARALAAQVDALYDGFVPASADKIFESTDAKAGRR